MQGFNMGRYVPPEFEGTTSGNRLHNKNALGSRANKSSQGVLTVRFEMPYPIWCTNCPKPTIIGQGVRFNAEKKKVATYYSTPIYSFRMKHTACGGWIEIRTDPKNTAYTVHEGARKRDTGEDRLLEGDGGLKILTEEEREERRNNAFAALEGKVEDKVRLEKAKERLEEIQEIQDEQWEDPYLLNQKLRRNFRAGRHQREKEAAITGALQDKMSLAIELLPANEDDARRAALVDFGAIDPDQAISKAISKPLFSNETRNSGCSPENARLEPKSRLGRSSKLKAVQLAEKRRAGFAAEIRHNTRARIDPFLSKQPASTNTSWKVVGVKRKREGNLKGNANTVAEMKDADVGGTSIGTADMSITGAITASLVSYDSD